MSETTQADILKSIASDPARPGFDVVMALDSLRFLAAHDKDDETACKYATDIIAFGTDLMAQKTLSEEKQMEVYSTLMRAYTTKAPYDFHSYLIALEWNRPAKKRFYLPRISTLKPVVDALTDMMVHDKYDILCLSMPARVGKSMLMALFMTWVNGRRPDDPNLVLSYSGQGSSGYYNNANMVYDDKNEYRYHEIFPKLECVHRSAQEYTIDLRDDGKPYVRNYKTMTCRGMEGGLNGICEAVGVLCCDDIIKDSQQGFKLERLDETWTSFTNNVRQREKEGCKEVFVGTRWSIYDPIGRIISLEEDNPRLKVFSLPALDEHGESNFNYKYGVGFSTEGFKHKMNGMDPVDVAAQLQQEPIEREGLLFRKDELQYRTVPIDRDFLDKNPPDDVFAFCDVGFGGSDYLALPIVYQWGQELVVGDVVFDNSDYKVTEPKVVGKLCKHKVRRITFEANNGGDFYARDITRMMKEAGVSINITSKSAPTQIGKVSRIIQHAPDVKELLFLDAPLRSMEYQQFMQNVLTFNQNGKNKHDDAPDALTGLVMMLKIGMPTVKVLDRQYI